MSAKDQRRKELIKLLSKPNGFSVKQLTTRLGVGKTAIYGMLDELRDEGAELPFAKKGVTTTLYRFLKPFDEDHQDVSLNLTRPLTVCLNFLESYKNNPFFTDIRHSLKQKIQEFQETDPTKKADERIVFFETPPLRKGTEHFQKILNAIIHKYKLSFEYDAAYRGIWETFLFLPYALKEHNGMWYVIGTTPSKFWIGCAALDRIRNLKIISKIAFVKEQVNLEIFYRDLFGIIPTDAPLTDIVLRFERNTGDWILSRPIHPSQELVSIDNKYVIVSIKVRYRKGDYISAREMFRELCKWGRDVKVLQPLELAGELKSILANAYNLYKECY